MIAEASKNSPFSLVEEKKESDTAYASKQIKNIKMHRSEEFRAIRDFFDKVVSKVEDMSKLEEDGVIGFLPYNKSGDPRFVEFKWEFKELTEAKKLIGHRYIEYLESELSYRNEPPDKARVKYNLSFCYV